MRRSIVALLLSGAAASVWAVSAPASECDLTIPGDNCSGASVWNSPRYGLPAGGGQLSFVQLLESSDPAAAGVPSSAPTPLQVASEVFPRRAPSGVDPLRTLFETVPIPEPGSWALPIAGLLGMYAVVRRRMLSS